MARATNELDVDDYYNLTIKQRDLLDDWLRSIGGLPTHTRKITLLNHICYAEEWVFDSDGKMIYNKKTHDVEILIKELQYDDGPPIWKRDKGII